MRLPVRFSFAFVVFGALLVCPGTRAEGQAAPASQSPSGQSSSTQGAPAQNPEPAPAPAYVSIDPLANVRYDNRYDLSVTLAYDHFKAGPNLLQGANLGGLESRRLLLAEQALALEGTGRAYLGTSGAAAQSFISNGHSETITGPFVAEYFFAAGPEFLGPHNKHGALMPMCSQAESTATSSTTCAGQPTSLVGFYNNQIRPRGPHGRPLRPEPLGSLGIPYVLDGLLTDYGINYGPKPPDDINFGRLGGS